MKFRLIDTGLNTPGINMAIDEALLSSELPVLRFYSWKPAGLSLGYFQATKDIDTDYCKKNNIEVVRRLTGGNAVLHEKELTYSFIIDANLMPFDIVESYKKISKGIMAGLNNLGLAPELSEHGTEEAGSAVCFEEPSWYEMTINNKKIVGSAQKRIDGKVLQHGAVLIDLDILPKSIMGGVLGFTYLESGKMTRRDDLFGDMAMLVDVHEAIHTPDEYETRVLTDWMLIREKPKYKE